MGFGSIVVLALFAFVAITIFKGVRIVPQGYKWIVQRLGKYHTTLNPGLNFVIPYVDEVAYKITTKDIVLGWCFKKYAEKNRLAFDKIVRCK